jgi:hypothetical protein
MKKLLVLTIGLAAWFVPARAQTCGNGNHCYYLRSNVAPPWDVTNNEIDMDDVFGSGAWTNDQYETVSVSRLFSNSTQFIFMEGGDNNANELQTFLDTNSTQVATWVAAGGRLFINAAPNQGSSINMGFGMTLNFDLTAYSTGSDNGYAVDPNHPIFADNLQPVGTSFSGGDAFSHGYLSGDGSTVTPSAILQDDQSRPVLVEFRWGKGLVLLGGMTMDIFQSPWPNTHNLRTNIIWYAATSQLQ